LGSKRTEISKYFLVGRRLAWTICQIIITVLLRKVRTPWGLFALLENYKDALKNGFDIWWSTELRLNKLFESG